MVRNTLRSLCCSSNGWCYGIFWGFDQRNSLLLTVKDAYYEEQMGSLIDNMLLQVHVLGGGAIGQAAFSRNHRWMRLNSNLVRKTCLGSSESHDDFEQDDSDFHSQSSMGIKTIAIISVEPWGVVQLGSTQEVLESNGFVDRVKLAFQEMGEGHKLEKSENVPSPSDAHFFNLGTQFSSLLSCDVSSSAIDSFQQCADSECFMQANYFPCIPSQSFAPNFDHQNTKSVFTAASLIEDQLQTGCMSDSQLDQLLQDSFSSFDLSPLTPTWSHGPRQNEPLLKPINSYESCMSSSLNVLGTPCLPDQQDTMNTSNSAVLSDPMDMSAQIIPSGLLTLDELFPGNADLCKPGLIPLSKLSEDSSPVNISEYRPTNSMQSSVTDVFRFNNENKFYDEAGLDRLLNDLGAERGCEKPDSWNGTPVPTAIGTNTDFATNVYEKKNIGSKVGTSNSLFSRLGLDQLLDGSACSSSSFAKSMYEDGSSSAAKRRKIDNYSWSQDTVIRHGVELNSEISNKESGSCVGDSMGAGNTSSSKRQLEPTKTGKKKAKSGSRPRPKDRQMIQDRLAELRGLIPNGEKMSIDRLLERTIRHLNFLSGLAKHSECLKQVNKTRSAAVQKDRSGNDGGVTWACEVGDQSMVCPLIVEDLTIPGQMLIEILYDESGFFLEIVDVIRSFGLTILKGVMEVRKTKIWAHFVVEAKGNRHSTRHEIFSSLIQLLQMTGGNRSNANEHFGNIISPGMPLFNNCQSAVGFPINLADTIQCANL